jgi:L-ascorbate metabolism protein UlaG (beta-lactamase superfamily)
MVKPDTFRWLGVAGLEITSAGHTLLIDPFFTRPSLWSLLSQARVPADALLAARYTPRADYILVTHAHYDHLLDVPVVMRQTGAQAYGSPNTCALLELQGISPAHLTRVYPGDHLDLGPFSVEVFPGFHTSTPLDWLINGPLPAGLTSARLPLRLIDYRMDACYSFRICIGDRSLLVGAHSVPADIFFIAPYQQLELLENTLQAVNPHLVIPIHWDDFTRPLSQPLRPMLATRVQGLKGWPPIRRLDLAVYCEQVRAALPESLVLIPQIFQPYPLFPDRSF